MAVLTLHQTIFNNTSLAASTTSTPMKLKVAVGYSVQLAITGSAVGSIKIQASNDSDEDGTGITHWSDIAYSALPVNGEGVIFYNVADAMYLWARVVYTRTSGTGTIDGIAVLKGAH